MQPGPGHWSTEREIDFSQTQHNSRRMTQWRDMHRAASGLWRAEWRREDQDQNTRRQKADTRLEALRLECDGGHGGEYSKYGKYRIQRVFVDAGTVVEVAGDIRGLPSLVCRSALCTAYLYVLNMSERPITTMCGDGGYERGGWEGQNIPGNTAADQDLPGCIRPNTGCIFIFGVPCPSPGHSARSLGQTVLCADGRIYAIFVLYLYILYIFGIFTVYLLYIYVLSTWYGTTYLPPMASPIL